MSFYLSKILWFSTAPGNLLTLFLVLGAVAATSSRAAVARFGRGLCLALAMLCLAVAVLPVGDWLLLPLENKFSPAVPAHVDGIIMLGGDENPRVSDARNSPTVVMSAERYLKTAALAQQYPDAKIVFTGGSELLRPYDKMKAVDIARQLLQGAGVAPERITFEGASRNTHENATFSAAIVHPEPQQNWLLVTSAWHMPRSVTTFRHAGWNVFPAPTAYYTDGKMWPPPEFNFNEHLYRTTTAVREYIGLVAYWLMGYSDSPWPE